jgi:hypothetical protein
MSKDVILICALIWSILYPIAATLNETMNSYRRVKIEGKEPYSDEIHGTSQIINIVLYLLGLSLFIYLLNLK